MPAQGLHEIEEPGGAGTWGRSQPFPAPGGFQRTVLASRLARAMPHLGHQVQCGRQLPGFRWTRRQAKLLRSGELQSLDVGNIAEEIETLGRSEAAALRSTLRLIVLHLLEAIHQPEMASRSWLSTIRRERISVERSLKDNPGLKSRLAVLFIEAYDDGREEALAETGLDRLPQQPDLTLDRVRDKTFIPPTLAGRERA